MSTRVLFFFLGLFASLGLLADQHQNYPFSVETEKESDGHRIVARNNGPAPVSVKVAIASSQNIAADRAFPVFAVVPPGGGTLYVARIRPAAAGMAYSFNTQSAWMLGDFNARHSPDATYRLPYQEGAAFPIGQSADGPITTHTTPDSHFAVDFGMPLGASVVAARDGVVIHTEAGQMEGGQQPEMMNKANEVRIQHRDGTIAIYAHLAHGGVHVYPGQHVAAGTPIGLAGSTGYSSGPHLHFAVQTVVRSGDQLAMTSLPIQFRVGNPPAVFAPRFGLLVTANYSSPGRAPEPGQPTRIAESSASVAGTPALVVSFEVPAPIRAWLLSIPKSTWVGAMSLIILLLIALDKRRLARRRQHFAAFREPTLHSRPAKEPVVHRLSPRDRLVIACGGDRHRADRLQADALRQSPGISDDEAAQRAWAQLQQDRRK